MALILLAVKGLHPGGGGDYYTHYFPYFRHVLLSHGLWPNDVWYHFYFSKGATITMTSMLLTDMLIPEVVSYLYFMVATLCVYSMMRRWVNNRVIPLLAMAACIGTFFWTTHPIYLEWGQFQKHHEFMGSLIMSVIWLAALVKDCQGPTAKAWMSFLALAAGHCILFTPTMFPMTCGILGSVLLASLLRRAWGVAWSMLAGVGAATVVLAATMIINYACTGMAEITPMRLFWKYADQERFSRWVSPYVVTVLLEGSSPEMGTLQLIDQGKLRLSRLEYAEIMARTEAVSILFPVFRSKRLPGNTNLSTTQDQVEAPATELRIPITLLLVLAVIGIQSFRGRRLSFEVWRLVPPVISALGLAVVLSQFAGQPVSTYRCFSFLTFASVFIGIGLWGTVLRLTPQRKLVLVTSYLLPAILTGVVSNQRIKAIPPGELSKAIRFARGNRHWSKAIEIPP